VLVLGGVLLEYESDYAVAGLYIAVMLALFGGLSLAESRGWRRDADRIDAGTRWLSTLFDPVLLRRLMLGFIGAVVPVLLVAPTLWASSVPRDIGTLSLLLAAVLALALLIRPGVARNLAPVVVRTIIYIGAACAVFVLTQYPGRDASAMTGPTSLLVAALAIAIGLFVRFLSERRFATTPTDYLIALGLLVLAAIDRVQVGAGGMVQFVTYVIVLFYGCEVVVGHVGRWRLALGLPTLAALAVLAFRGLASGA
jgi:hypothetical protein